MPWGAAVAAGITYIGAKSSERSARKAQKSQDRMMKAQLDFAKEQYKDYKDLYGDLESGLISDVESYQPGQKLQEYLGEATADVQMAYGKRQGMMTRQMGRYGIDPSQARFEEKADELGRERTLAEVSARHTARKRSEAEDDKIFARKLAMLSTGKQIPGQAGAVMGALQDTAGMYGRQAAQYGKGAAAGYGAAGQWAARGISDYMSQPAMQPSSYNTNPGVYTDTQAPAPQGEWGTGYGL